MIKTPFMPPLNSKWRLTNDVRMPDNFFTRQDHQVTFGIMGAWDWLKSVNRDKEPGKDWIPDYQAYEKTVWPDGLTIPAGTVISFNRYHASNSGWVQITLQFIASPDPRLTPKKRGGKGKGPMRFYVKLDEFNMLGELEEASDVCD
jgi:hypothetical protein